MNKIRIQQQITTCYSFFSNENLFSMKVKYIPTYIKNKLIWDFLCVTEDNNRNNLAAKKMKKKNVFKAKRNI